MIKKFVRKDRALGDISSRAPRAPKTQRVNGGPGGPEDPDLGCCEWPAVNPVTIICRLTAKKVTTNITNPDPHDIKFNIEILVADGYDINW